MKKIILCCIILLSLGLVGCAQNDDSLIGVWQLDTASDFIVYIIFNDDGSGEQRRVEGSEMSFYTITEFYWELIEEGVFLQDTIQTIQFRGMENRDNPPTILFDSSDPNADVTPLERPFEFYRGNLILGEATWIPTSLPTD